MGGRSFLSQSLNSEIQLTLDHGSNLCEFWELDEDRTDYFLDLMTFERAASQSLRLRLKGRLEQRREASRRIGQRQTAQSDLSTSIKETVYYSSWHYAAIHVLTAIPSYQNIQSIAKRLELSTTLVEKTLRDLQSLNLVKEDMGKWIVHRASVFLKKESPISPINQANWRNQGMKHLSHHPSDGIHASALYAISKKDAENVMGFLNHAFEKSNQLSVESEEEELYCMNIDFFAV